MNFDIETEPARKKKKQKKKKKMYNLVLGAFCICVFIVLMTYLILASGNSMRKKSPKPQEVKQVSKLKIYDENSNDRPIAFMIDNNIGDAKHAGLQDSFLNYEIIVEGGLTRIMAIFKDKNTNLIGPIRSSRHYFLDYALESDAIYAHYGWSPQAQSDIGTLGVDNINGMTDSKAYRRDNNSTAPHNVFTNIDYIKDVLDSKNYSDKSNNWKLLKISSDKIDLSDASEDNNASKIDLTYSQNQYRSYIYDESNGYYLRSQNGNPHLDRQTNEQLHYKNIIIIKVKNSQLDSSGRQDLETTGQGEGIYITNGHYKKIMWTKDSRKAKSVYTYVDGEEIKLNDGNTFIQVLPINSNITIE